MERQVKQVIVFRKDLLKGDKAIRKGKFAGQVAHASVGALMECAWKNKFHSADPDAKDKMINEWRFVFADTDNSPLNIWLNGIFTKIVVGIDETTIIENNKEVKLTADENLVRLFNNIKQKNPSIPVKLITDCGNTEFHGVPTNTCIGIGPWWSDEIDMFTSDLQLL